MNRFFPILYMIFILNCAFASEDDQRKITVHNKNVKWVGTGFKNIYRETKDLEGSSVNCYQINTGERKTFALTGIGAQDKYDTAVSLNIAETFASCVTLNITLDGRLRFNDTVTIEKRGNVVSLSNGAEFYEELSLNTGILCLGRDQALVKSAALSSGKITIHNKDLAQIIVVQTMIRSPLSNTRDFFKLDVLFPIKITKNDFSKNDEEGNITKYALRGGEKVEIDTCLSCNRFSVISTFTQIRISQAAQDVIVNVDGIEISSGDILRLRTLPTDKTIEIVRIRSGVKELLAKLFSNNFEANQVTLG